MNKILVSSLVTVVALGANVASAQSYYPSYNYGTTYTQPYSGACVNLATDLSYGSRGSQVSQLQTFLVSRNYPGGGTWMITGNFRLATQTAVRNFQMEQNLPQTGVVDAATRAAISRVSCGGSVGYNYNNYNYNTNPFTYSTLPTYTYNNNNNYNYNNNSNCYYTYPYTCNNNSYNYGYGVTLTSLSPVSGEPGTSLTIYGTNLDYANNTVYFGSQPVANVPSTNGTSLVVTVPGGLTPGGAGVYVTNSRGTSNTLTFNVIASYSACNNNLYTYGVYNPYTTTYCPPNINTPYITYLNPASGAVGSTVTIYGSGFSPTGNTVRFGGGVITGLNSTDGRTVSFIVPSSLFGYSSQIVTQSTYNVSVSSFSGQTSNALPFTVTSTGSGTSGNVSLSYLTPTSGRVGTQVMLQGSGFNALDNTVRFGIGGTLHVPSFNNGTAIYYTIPSYVSPCDIVIPSSNTVCAQNVQQIVPGPVQLYVTNTTGTSQTLMFQVQQ